MPPQQYINRAAQYQITSPQKQPVDPSLVDRVARTLDSLKVKPSSGWRFVILPEDSWTSAVQTYGIKDGNRGAFTHLPSHTTYFRASALNGRDSDITNLVAHEMAHRAGASEDQANAAGSAQQNTAIQPAIIMAHLPAYMTAQRAQAAMDNSLLVGSSGRNIAAGALWGMTKK